MNKDQNAELAARAERLRPILRGQSRRAFVLELTGTPKAGKTTSVAVIERFFKECGYRVRVLREKAAECPLSMKGHFFFNTWTACAMLAEVLATVDTNVDLLILDRGFFDALIWLELQDRLGQVTEEEKEAFERFLLLDRWRRLVDVTLVITTSPEKALARENGPLIVPRSGSVMNESFLNQFNQILAQLARDRADAFRILQADTSSDRPIREANADIIEQFLPVLEDWADPHIAVIPRKTIREALSDGPKWEDEAKECWEALSPSVQLSRRSRAEKDDSLVQVVACGVQTNTDGDVFLLRRSEADDKASTYGRHTVWKGCHIATSERTVSLQLMGQILVTRLQADLHLSGTKLDRELLGVVWHPDATESNHLGVFFRVPVQDEFVAKSLSDKEFRQSGRGHTLSGMFRSPDTLLEESSDLELEPWSVDVLTRLKE